MMSLARFAGLPSLLCATILFASSPASADHAPSIFYRVPNDNVKTDRFASVEEAARVSVDERGPAAWEYHHVTQVSASAWNIFYLFHRPDGTVTGPHFYGSSAFKYYVCDPTPIATGSNSGLPKVHSTSPYPNGCPTPETDAHKHSCDPNCAGNPINVGFMNKVQLESDYRGAGAFPLTFSRRYDSLGFIDGAMTPYRTLGERWRHNYDRAVTAATVGSVTSAAVLRPSGNISHFTLTGGAWVPDADIEDTLIQLVDGSGTPIGWSYETTEHEIESYDVSGRLLSISDRQGRTQTLLYSDASTPGSIAPVPGLLLSVTDDFGRSLQFTYNIQRRIQTLTVPGGGAFTYTYDTSDNLQTATYPDTRVRTYVYSEAAYMQNNPRRNYLTGIIDESGTRFATFSYDAAAGRAVGTTHAGGADAISIAYSVNSNKNVTSAVITDAIGTARTRQFQFRIGVVKNTAVTQGGASTAIALDANGNATSRADFLGNKTCYAYDLTRNLETVRVEGFASGISCPANLSIYVSTSGTRQRKISTSWHSTYRKPAQIAETGRSTGFTYDSAGNVLTRTITDTATSQTRTWTYTYNSYGQVLTDDGPRTDVSDVTTYTYYSCTTGDECGQLHTVTNALSRTTTYNTYDAHGQPLTITDPNGAVTTLTYDLRQRLTSRDVDGDTTNFEYWPTGLLKKATLADGSFTLYIYDDAHRLTEIEDGDGNRIEYTLDAMGNRTAEEVYDPSSTLSRTRTHAFNSLNQLWKQLGAAGTSAVTTTFGYDNDGNPTSANAPLSRNTSRLYDELDRLKQITDPGSGVTQIAYDANDNLTSVTDPRTLVTSYTYNGFGDLTQQVSPDTGTTVNTYDSGGNLATTTDARTKTGTYGYDALNRVTSLVYPDRTITYTYDSGTNGLGRLTGASASDHSLAWSYDAQGRVTGKGQTLGAITKSVGYGYTDGRLTSLVTPSGQTITYGYANGRIDTITLNGSTTILSDVLYEPFGPVAGWTWGNGTVAARVHDLDGKPTDVDSAGAYTYAYDDAFRITGITDVADGTKSWTYGYDVLDRLNAASRTAETIGYTYDANGNRLTQTGTSAGSYTVSGTNNRVTSITGTPARTYGYDAAGNVTSYAGLTFTYTDAGRMDSSTSGATTTTYLVNALGQRVKKSDASTTLLFLYDEAGHLVGEYDASGALVQETIWMNDAPVATLRSNGSGGVNVFYVHTDHVNTPRRISRPSDNMILWRWDSDPFGSSSANEDPDGDTNLFVFNPRFPGQYFDTESGLSYNYFRDYDPNVGRYVESDPIGLRGGLNTYSYALANPVSYTDPRGKAIYQGVRGAWWLGGRIGAGINWGVGILTGGLSIGSIVYDMCNEEEYECDKILEDEIQDCYDQYADLDERADWMRNGCIDRAKKRFAACNRNGGTMPPDAPGPWGDQDVDGHGRR
jgi:RHS repeat-associated protein